MNVEKFHPVKCPDSDKRWVLDDTVHANINKAADGTYVWAAWIDDLDGTIMSGHAPSANKAEMLAKNAAVRLLAESEEHSQLLSMLPTEGDTIVSLRKAK